jgi:CRISPR/Cas system CSM-associated protein Csm2 small subunit
MKSWVRQSKMNKEMNTAEMRPYIDARNAEMIKMYDSGEYTLQAIASKYHISRERVRQIYKRITGKPSDIYRATQRYEKITAKEKHDKKIKFHCALCHTPVTYGEKSKRLYCGECRATMLISQRDATRTSICKACGASFHPFRYLSGNTKAKGVGLFCSMACYRAKVFTKICRYCHKPIEHAGHRTVTHPECHIKEGVERMRIYHQLHRKELNEKRKDYYVTHHVKQSTVGVHQKAATLPRPI